MFFFAVTEKATIKKLFPSLIIIFILRVYLFLPACMCLVLWGPEKDVKSLEWSYSEVTDSCGPRYGFWKLNLDPLKDPVANLTELFLQPLWESLNTTLSESKHIGPWICTGGQIPCHTQSP